MPRLPLALLTMTAAALLLAGCADSGGSPAGESTPESTPPSPSTSSAAASSPAPAPDSAGTSLTVDFSQDGTATTDTYTLECDGAAPAGDSAAPDPAAACAVLAAQGAALFAPPSADTMCTQMIQGMQRAHVSGTVNGEAVDADFSLTNGCEISRWEKLTGLLGPAEGTL
ncbi:serine protease inhibitor [Arthrobacter sp. zg-ZUI100]|uniref:serine protease inhibitor n=1 Tax=Arthrobacter jiangjiafuii TaxID=2817475 RepID=UPI001AEF056F|nr:serine protease inhibitor [Arthrobacter jiangjiafuii]MBP3035867.1 serine protease inhibitor [Arthrobacter jiangjiafuii]